MNDIDMHDDYHTYLKKHGKWISFKDWEYSKYTYQGGRIKGISEKLGIVNARTVSFDDAMQGIWARERFTLTHLSREAYTKTLEGYAGPPYGSDYEWYVCTRFPGEAGWDGKVTGRYWERREIASWPVGRWLEEPYVLGTKVCGRSADRIIMAAAHGSAKMDL